MDVGESPSCPHIQITNSIPAGGFTEPPDFGSRGNAFHHQPKRSAFLLNATSGTHAVVYRRRVCFFSPLHLHLYWYLLWVFTSLLSPLLNLCESFRGSLKMGDEMISSVASTDNNANNSYVVDIYPLSCYYFGSKEAVPIKDETLDERIQRMRINYTNNGLRTCVEAVILVELFKHPHLLLLQVRNSFFKLPGGRLRPGESDTDGLKRKLSSKLSIDASSDDWMVGECLGMWWRPDFETLQFPYLPPNIKRPKECTKLFLVKLHASQKFTVPRNMKLLAVPLCQIHESHKTYGPIISGVPQLLSRFSFNIIEP